MKASTSGSRSISPTRMDPIGDYVLSGGELAALVLMETVSSEDPGIFRERGVARRGQWLVSDVYASRNFRSAKRKEVGRAEGVAFRRS